MSHSLKVVRMAAVCCAITSCCAIFRRNGDIFLRMNRPSVDGSASAGDGAARRGKLTASPTGSALPRPSAAFSTSALVKRPPGPVPGIFSGSSFFSSTIRRTAGESSVLGVGAPDWPWSTSVATASFFSASFFAASGRFLFSSGAFFGVASAFCTVASFESSIVATTSPILTSWPSGTFVSSRPGFSATISVETLSVSSVSSGSPSLTNSPDFLCQTETTPLVIDSRTAGIFTSMTMRENYSVCGTNRASRSSDVSSTKAGRRTSASRYEQNRRIMAELKQSKEAMQRIFVLADTHNRLPQRVKEIARGADEIWHLGDVCTETVIDELRAVRPRITVVRGNCDSNLDWPLVVDLERSGLNFRLQHVPPDQTPNDVDVVLHGHTHVPRNERRGSILFLNPGCVTRANQGAPPSVAWLEIADGKMNWKLVPLR